MPLSFMNDEAVIVRPSTRTERGATVKDWKFATQHTVKNVQIVPVSTSQDRDGRVVNVNDRFKFRAKYEADVKPGDRVIWNGETFEIDGDVFHVKSPTGRVSSTRCTLARWKG